jgi:hypothetical protein
LPCLSRAGGGRGTLTRALQRAVRLPCEPRGKVPNPAS